MKVCSWCQDPTSGWELQRDGIFHPGSQGMRSRDEEGQGYHTLGSTGGSRNPGLPAGFGNGAPKAAARAVRPFEPCLFLWIMDKLLGTWKLLTLGHLLILAVVFQPHFFHKAHQILLKNPRELWHSSSHPFFFCSLLFPHFLTPQWDPISTSPWTTSKGHIQSWE